MEKNNTNMGLIAIIAIVAIVGMIVLFTNSNSNAVASTMGNEISDDSDNVGGLAIINTKSSLIINTRSELLKQSDVADAYSQINQELGSEYAEEFLTKLQYEDETLSTEHIGCWCCDVFGWPICCGWCLDYCWNHAKPQSYE